MVRAPTAAARATVPPGTRLGRYEILATIAHGGMATVYLGRALGAAGFQRLVAIKCLHPHVAADEQFVDMFMDEARLAARIRHPNVVPTLDLENGDDGLFLVMEYVEGDGLLGLLRAAAKQGEAIPPMIAIRIMLDVLHGLQAAHELTGDRGEPLRIVHRDVSPHNILVGTDGICRITDFGIARAESRVTHTREGQIKGKLSYMAPEQTAGEEVDRRADLFSSGIVLWECLAARRLFKGDSDAEVLRNLLEAPVPLLSAQHGFPASIDAVLAKALARKPDERWPTAAAFAEALEDAGSAVGMASTRAVAEYVRKTAGVKVAQMQEQVRAFGGSEPRPVRASTVSPDETAEALTEEDLTQSDTTDTAVRIARGQMVIPATPPPLRDNLPADAHDALPQQMAQQTAPAPVGVPASAVAAMAYPSQSRPRKDQNLIIAGVAVLLLLTGVAVALLFFALRGDDTATATPGTATTTPTPTSPATVVDVSSLPMVGTPEATTAAPTPTFRPTARPHPAAHATAKPSATTATTTATPTTAAPPASNVPFNPEAM
jgi:serine/threonine-protein kinase